MKLKKLFFLTTTVLLTTASFAQTQYDISAFGAKPGVSFNSGPSIQKAIDAATKKGGGRVVIPAGVYLTGPLLLKSGVELHFNDNALLLGSTQRADYSEGKMAIVTANGQSNVSVTGNGTIDGQGQELVESTIALLRKGTIHDEDWLVKRPGEGNRTNIFFFYNCTNVNVTGVTVKNAASWVQNYKNCDGVSIDHIKVQSTAYWNNDGIDIVDSKNVKITNCVINAADDGICLKSEDRNGHCENVYVSNCRIRSSANAFKLGTGSFGTFKNITVRNLMVYDTYRSAVALETVDGADMENIDIRNIEAKNTGNAVFIRLGHRNKDSKYGTVKHVLVSDVKVEVPLTKPDAGYPLEGPLPKVPPHNLLPASITGILGHAVCDITLQNIEVTYAGGASKEKAYISTDSLSKIPEQTANYPEFTMFGELPAWGLYIRHAEGVKLKNITFKLASNDFRPAIVFDDVKGLDVQKLVLPESKTKQLVIFNKVSESSIK
jgi:polygalacturonase